jgi:hypothetical protein
MHLALNLGLDTRRYQEVVDEGVEHRALAAQVEVVVVVEEEVVVEVEVVVLVEEEVEEVAVVMMQKMGKVVVVLLGVQLMVLRDLAEVDRSLA